MRLKVFICLLLAGITLAIYWPASHFSFVYYDDQLFLLRPEVASGLNVYSIDWAIKGTVSADWQPIILFSFLLVHQFFGLNPGAEHLVNVFFHAANTVLLFLVLVQMTSATWRSGIVAAIFAWHPLRVESVAWIAERKDVLFTFFMLFSLWGYAFYAQAKREKPVSGTPTKPSFLSPIGYYNLSLAFFIASFLCKAMVVTLPFLFLLLDYWPLQRLNRSTIRPLISEKIRFFALSAFFCTLTFWTHKTHADIHSLQNFGVGMRVENAILSYVNYLGKFFWPANLAVLYPYPQSYDIVQVMLAALLLLAISVFCILQISRRPYLAVGWFWYLGAMLPVIGFVRFGDQAMADRFTYITLIGPSVSLIWLVWEWVRNSSLWKCLALSVTVVVLAACVVLTVRQLQFWRDTVTLFTHTIAVTPENGVAEYTLALGLEHERLLRQASVHYRIATTMRPDANHFVANFYFAELLANSGYYQEAEKRLEAALQIDPNSTGAMNNLAWTLATAPDANARDGARAVQWAERACELTHSQNPNYMTTLAAAYAEAGRFDDAVDMTQKAIALAEQYNNEQFYEANQELLPTYQAHKTYVQTHAVPIQSP